MSLENPPLTLTPTAVKTANYTAVAGDFVPVDTTSGSVTIMLTSAPADKSVLGVKHVIQGGSSSVTVNCGGSDVFNKAGGATSVTLSLLAQGLLLQYKASGGLWYVVADDLPLSQLDSRFSPIAGSSSIVTVGTIGSGTWAATNLAESQVTNLVSDLAAKAADNAVVHLAGTETVTGLKTFQSQAAGTVGLVVQTASSPTADALEVQDSVGNVQARLDKIGNLGVGIVPTYGMHVLGSGRFQAISGLAAPSVAVNVTGATTFNYAIAAEDRGGNRTIVSSSTQVTNSAIAASINNTITWSAATGAIKYYVLRATAAVGNGANSTLVGTWTSGALSFTDTVTSPSSITTPFTNGTGSLTVDENLTVGGAGSFAGNLACSGAFSTPTLQVATFGTAAVACTLKTTPSATADFVQMQNSASVILAKFDVTAALSTFGTTTTHSNLATPTNLIITNGGATGATTYGYRVSAVNAAGETVACATATTTTGNATLSGTNFNTLTWTAVSGATSYKVYGRTSGSELFMTTINAPTVTYNDTKAVVTPSGALPSAPAGTKLVARAWESQTANTQEWQGPTGTALSGVLPAGHVATLSAGVGFQVKEGSNARMGQATLSAGAVTVSNTSVTANTRIFLSNAGGTITNLGEHYVSAVSAGTSFTISSSNVLDASLINWLLIEPS